MDDRPTARVAELNVAVRSIGRQTGESRLTPQLLSASLLTLADVQMGYVLDPGAASTIAIFSGDRVPSLAELRVEAHFARPGVDQIIEENIRSYGSISDAKSSFNRACRAAEAFVSFTSGDNPSISVTTMPLPNYGDETFALRLNASDSLAAVASHVRIGRLQVTVLMAGGVVDQRVLVTMTHRAVEKVKAIRQ